MTQKLLKIGSILSSLFNCCDLAGFGWISNGIIVNSVYMSWVSSWKSLTFTHHRNSQKERLAIATFQLYFHFLCKSQWD